MTARGSRIIKPMLATLVDAPFDDPGWIFETKWDGFRILAKARPGRNALLYSRGGLNVTKIYPAIAAALSKVRHDAVLDGELVALDRAGRSRFQLLQNAASRRVRLRYYIFDLLSLDGRDTRRLPLVERKKLLSGLVPRSSLVRFSTHVRCHGIRAFRAARKRHLEGIVAKRADSPYRSGRRTRDWLKIKTARRQEVVIVGFTRPRASRKHFGALVLAVRQGRSWTYAGRTGTGFDASTLKSLHARLSRLQTSRPPFKSLPAGSGGTIWVRPRLVCEVKFTEWTRGGQMRHPAFVGLRSDKPAGRVVRERERHV